MKTLLTVSLLLQAASANAAYWVSSNGAAAWAACESAAPIDGTSACALATANAHAAAGDVINLRGGTYNTSIQPVNSGTSINPLTYQGYNDETVTITNVGNHAGITLSGVDYVRITSVTVQNVYMLVDIRDGSDYNEIAYCRLHTGTGPANNGVNILTINATPATKNTHNWIHHCVIYEGGYIKAGCEDAGGLVSIGADNEYDGISDHNTLEHNEIFWGAHHALKVNTRGNVIRNNFIHNEGHFPASATCQSHRCALHGVYGNRALTVLNNHNEVPAWFSDTYNLIENNRIGSAGLPSDGNGADSLTLGGERDIARYNMIFNAMELGIYFRASGNIAQNNRVYNNSVVGNGRGPACRVDNFSGFWRGGVRLPNGADNNALKNNIIYGNLGTEWSNNSTGNLVVQNWFTSDGDPRFVNASVAYNPDLSLQSNSAAINNGTHLTQAVGAGANSTSLHVEDALYFQYGERGSALSSVQADWIAVGTVANAAQIQTIDYANGAITLASPLSWSDQAPVWLYRDSTGQQILHGAAPDQGAGESAVITPPLSSGGPDDAQVEIQSTQSNLARVRVYPNPWRSDRHPTRTIVFDNLTVSTKIKIFTVSGHYVKTLPTSNTSVIWDLTNSSGDRVAAGIYLYVMDAEDEKRTGKVIVIK